MTIRTSRKYGTGIRNLVSLSYHPESNRIYRSPTGFKQNRTPFGSKTIRKWQTQSDPGRPNNPGAVSDLDI